MCDVYRCLWLAAVAYLCHITHSLLWRSTAALCCRARACARLHSWENRSSLWARAGRLWEKKVHKKDEGHRRWRATENTDFDAQTQAVRMFFPFFHDQVPPKKTKLWRLWHDDPSSFQIKLDNKTVSSLQRCAGQKKSPDNDKQEPIWKKVWLGKWPAEGSRNYKVVRTRLRSWPPVVALPQIQQGINVSLPEYDVKSWRGLMPVQSLLL